jgi:hypothetical protein
MANSTFKTKAMIAQTERAADISMAQARDAQKRADALKKEGATSKGSVDAAEDFAAQMKRQSEALEGKADAEEEEYSEMQKDAPDMLIDNDRRSKAEEEDSSSSSSSKSSSSSDNASSEKERATDVVRPDPEAVARAEANAESKGDTQDAVELQRLGADAADAKVAVVAGAERKKQAEDKLKVVESGAKAMRFSRKKDLPGEVMGTSLKEAEKEMAMASHVEEAAVAKEKAAESAVSEKEATLSGNAPRAEAAALAKKEADAEAAMADAEVAEESGNGRSNVNITRARLAMEAADAMEAAAMADAAARKATAQLNGLSSMAEKKSAMMARMQSARANVTAAMAVVNASKVDAPGFPTTERGKAESRLQEAKLTVMHMEKELSEGDLKMLAKIAEEDQETAVKKDHQLTSAMRLGVATAIQKASIASIQADSAADKSEEAKLKYVLSTQAAADARAMAIDAQKNGGVATKDRAKAVHARLRALELHREAHAIMVLAKRRAQELKADLGLPENAASGASGSTGPTGTGSTGATGTAAYLRLEKDLEPLLRVQASTGPTGSASGSSGASGSTGSSESDSGKVKAEVEKLESMAGRPSMVEEVIEDEEEAKGTDLSSQSRFKVEGDTFSGEEVREEIAREEISEDAAVAANGTKGESKDMAAFTDAITAPAGANLPSAVDVYPVSAHPTSALVHPNDTAIVSGAIDDELKEMGFPVGGWKKRHPNGLSYSTTEYMDPAELPEAVRIREGLQANTSDSNSTDKKTTDSKLKEAAADAAADAAAQKLVKSSNDKGALRDLFGHVKVHGEGRNHHILEMSAAAKLLQEKVLARDALRDATKADKEQETAYEEKKEQLSNDIKVAEKIFLRRRIQGSGVQTGPDASTARRG